MGLIRVTEYNRFCKAFDEERVRIDTASLQSQPGLRTLKKAGWKFNYFTRDKKILRTARENEEKFLFVIFDCGIDIFEQYEGH